MFRATQVYDEQRAIFQELNEKREKLAAEFKTLQSAHDPLKRRLADANRKSHGLSQEITKTVLSPPFLDVDLETIDFFFHVSVQFIVDIVYKVTTFGLCCMCGFLVVSTSANSCLERLVSEMTYYVSSGT